MFLKKEGTVIIDDVNNIMLLRQDKNNYIVLNNESVTLECNESDYLDIWKAKLIDENASYNIQYQWNLLSPHKGKAIKVKRID
ncbi:MAG: hypothetical protein K0R84_324 [Clostridia bacterium]|jgi:hypothetical protein|nr:hypothetical protein [Clostridia bacterium]